MEIVREGPSRSFTVGASDKFPVIDDGKFHTLTWARLPNGEMTVSIDGDMVLKIYEVFYRKSFTGLGLMNNGGSHKWDSVKISKP